MEADARLAPIYAYVGCFTSKARRARGEGISVYRLDRESGAWTQIQLLGDLVDPAFLAFGRRGRHLYAIHAGTGEVSAFTIDPATGRLAFLNRQPVGGENPVHLAIDPSNRFIVTGNYRAGTLSLLPIRPDGSLGPRTESIKLSGEPGPHRTEQESAHPHHVPFDPSGRFLLVPDKGLDRVFVFRFDSAAGRLSPHDPPHVTTRAGAGPRHLAFHPRLPVAYLINEIDSTLTTYAWDAGRGTLEALQILPTLPASFTGDSIASEIVAAPCGRFVYGSNRGHDSIAVFAVDQASGLLSAVGWDSTQGSMPRFFTLDPSARLLYVANQESDTVVAFQVDAPRAG